MVRLVAEEFLTDERDRKYYADNYRCCPPPLFILLITIFEVSSKQIITLKNYLYQKRIHKEYNIKDFISSYIFNLHRIIK